MSLKPDATPPDATLDPGRDETAALQGAILSATQMKWVKVSIAIMTALLAIGIPVLIGRVIYLARYGTSASQAAATAAATAPDAPLAATARLALPAGAQIKTLTLSGNRLAIHHAADGGREEIIILDLTTGTVASRVELTRGR